MLNNQDLFDEFVEDEPSGLGFSSVMVGSSLGFFETTLEVYCN